jgi:hypothetical protein
VRHTTPTHDLLARVLYLLRLCPPTHPQALARLTKLEAYLTRRLNR